MVWLAGASSVPRSKACARARAGMSKQGGKRRQHGADLHGWSKHTGITLVGEPPSLLPRHPFQNWIMPSLEQGETYAEGGPNWWNQRLLPVIIERYPWTERRQGHRRWGV